MLEWNAHLLGLQRVRLRFECCDFFRRCEEKKSCCEWISKKLKPFTHKRKTVGISIPSDKAFLPPPLN